MKFLVIVCLSVLCLAHIESVRKRGPNLVSITSYGTIGESPMADFIGGGTIQDSCRGEVEFTSKLNHWRKTLDWLRYEITLDNGEKKEFEGWWYWKATASFMAEFDFDEDETWGDVGDEDGWQEECEERSTDISQCDRMFGHNMYYPERIKPNNGILTGKGDPQNPIYYDITFNSKTKDGCTQKWTDRLVIQIKTPN